MCAKANCSPSSRLLNSTSSLTRPRPTWRPRRATRALAKVTADRYQGLIGQNAVSQQDTDNAVQTLEARNTEVTSAQANVHRLEELQSFERIEAPFDGVITARNLDIGQLITAAGSTTTPGAGTISGSKEVFDISAIQTLRVFINVPQVYAPDAKKGVTATLTLPQYPGRTFRGKLVRTSDAVDPATRTLLAEVDVDNRSGELLPGSYTEVHLNVSNPAPALIVPVSALILEPDGLHVAVVDATQHAHIVRVTPGRDSGSTMEILGGLAAWAASHRQSSRLPYRWRAGARGDARQRQSEPAGGVPSMNLHGPRGWIAITLPVALALAAAWSGQTIRRPLSLRRLSYSDNGHYGDWASAKPADAADRGAWWTIYQNPELNDLEQRCASANQNIAAALHAYEQAHDLVRENRASLYPTVSIGGRGHPQRSLRQPAERLRTHDAELLGLPDSSEHFVGARLLGRNSPPD